MFWKKSIPGKSYFKRGDLNVEIRQKQIRNLYLRVYPDEGRVVLSAPVGIGMAEMESFIQKKTEWIQKHLSQKTRRVSINSLRADDGEMVPLWGECKRIQYVRGKKSRMAAEPAGDELAICLRKKDGQAAAHRLLQEFYRKEMKKKIPDYITTYESKMGIRVREFGVKKMKTRWGSCNTRDRRIWLNLELALYPPSVLEFVVVHEMVHLLERLHNRRFYHFMDQFLPNWRNREQILLSERTNYCK